MAQTKRTLAEVFAILADNTAGDISPQDVRDAVLSLSGSYGQINQSDNASETTITDSVTYFPITYSATVLGASMEDFDMPASGQLRYIGPSVIVVKVTCVLHFESLSANQTFRFRLGKNSTSSAETDVIIDAQNANEHIPLTLQWLVSMNTNDFIEAFVKNTTSTGNIKSDDINMIASTILS